MSTTDEANAPEVGRAKLFRNGRNQAVRVPREYELDGDEVFIHRETGRLIIEPEDPAPKAEDVF